MGGIPLRYLLALALAAVGLLLVGCGATVCWQRFCRRDKSR